MLENIISQISDAMATMKTLDVTAIQDAAIMLADCLKNGNKILTVDDTARKLVLSFNGKVQTQT